MTVNLFNRVAFLFNRRSLVILWQVNGFTNYRQIGGIR